MQVQQSLERQYRGFLYSLDPERTITLRGLIRDPERGKRLLDASWIDCDDLVAYLKSGERFLEGIAETEEVEGLGRYKGAQLMFLQRVSSEELQAEHERLCRERKVYRVLNKGRIPDLSYLITDSDFHGHLTGTWRARNRRLRPMMNFTSRRPGYKRDRNGKTWREKPSIIGYGIINFPELLGVSERTATAYLARSFLHDFGHGFLPSVWGKGEVLHNIAFVSAMGGARHSTEDPWERLILAECTDPYFFLDIEERCEGLGKLNPVQEHTLRVYRSWYLGEKRERGPRDWQSAEELRRVLFGITAEMDPTETRERVDQTISELQATGFRRYAEVSRLKEERKKRRKE